MRSPLSRRRFLATTATSLAALALTPRGGRAADLRPRLELLLAAPELAEGDRKALRAELLVRAARVDAVMLTPASEGPAVEVVRGRLTGEDAEPFALPDGRRGLRFSIPVAAHAPGTSVVRVHANLYGCDERCVALETSAQLTLRVQRATA